MKFSINNRLAFSLAKISVSVAFILGLLLSSLQVYLDYQEQEKSLDQMVAKILSVADRPASTSVHLLSKDLAKEVVSGLLEYDFIEQAIITDDLKLVLAEEKRSINPHKTIDKLTGYLSSQHKEYSIKLLAPSVTIESPGKLSVIVNVNVVFASFYDRAIIVFTSGVVRNMLLSLLLLIIFYYIIAKPLSELSNELAKRNPSEPGTTTIQPPKGHQNDELGLLINSVNQFLTGSREHIKELNHKNDALEVAKDILLSSENKYKNLYQGSEVSIWEEDFSQLNIELNRLRDEGVKDIKTYLLNNRQYLKKLATMVRVIDVNEATLRMFDAENSGDFIDNISLVFDTECSLSVFAEEVEAIWLKKSHFCREVMQRTLKGKIITTILSLPIPQLESDFARVPVTLVDITQLKAAQAQLRKLSLAVEHNPSAVVITDLEGVIEYANPKVTKITDYHNDELVGNFISLLRTGEYAKKSEQDILTRLMEGGEWRGEISAKKKNGEIFWAREFVAPIKDENDSITHFVVIYEDISEEKRVFEEISYRATHDKLTQLINRDEFERRLERVVATAQDNESAHILCFMDLDQFKVVNDTSGHIAGDELLVLLSRVLQQQIRKRDTIARIGGDEFAMLLEHCELPQALECMEEVREAVEAFQFEWESHTYKITISIGVTVINKNTSGTIELLKQADLACYVAKDRGRNQVNIYDVKNQQISLREGEMHLVSKISKALKNNQFELYAQPIVPLLTSDCYERYEILVRMQGENGEIIPPGKFLPSAERYGLSTAIDKWVIENLFNWVMKNSHKLHRVEHFAINLSGNSIGSSSILNCIAKQFKNKQTPPSLFSFEITETAAIGNLLEANHFINSIKNYGCTVSLDDFGSGLSSFAYLKNLPVDYLKIDGMFVKEIVNDPIDEAMVRSINDIGHTMGIKTIAEFVENDAIRKRLCEIKVDYAQGYGISQPVPIEQIFNLKLATAG